MAQLPRVAIIGYGAVGRALADLFPGAVVYDPPLGLGTRDQVNTCRYAFICVPTPASEDGACDTSIVEDACAWLECEHIIIRSTVSTGTTARLRRRTGKRIIFQPEYGPGETPDHPFKSLWDIRWIILGGPREDTIPVADLYKRVFNANITIHQTTAETAELCKYMENTFLALKVAFCNEFYDIAEGMGVDYNELRELWLLDPRIGRSHTFVFPDDRGFGGKCLPKDVSAIVATAAALSGAEPVLLRAILESNRRVRGREA